MCGKTFGALSEESLYDSPLDLDLSVEALAVVPVLRARQYCISSTGIVPFILSAEIVPVILSGPRAEVKPANLD